MAGPIREIDTTPVSSSVGWSANDRWAITGYGDEALPARGRVVSIDAGIITITSVNQGTKFFGCALGHAIPDFFQVGQTITVSGSTGNDGSYTIVSRTSYGVTVAEAIPSAVADGGFRNATTGKGRATEIRLTDGGAGYPEWIADNNPMEAGVPSLTPHSPWILFNITSVGNQKPRHRERKIAP